LNRLSNSYSTFACVFTIKKPKGASAARARGVLIVNILNKCILSILVYNLFLDRQCNILYTSHYFHTPVYWLSSWNRNSNFQTIRLTDWAKKGSDTKSTRMYFEIAKQNGYLDSSAGPVGLDLSWKPLL